MIHWIHQNRYVWGAKKSISSFFERKAKPFNKVGTSCMIDSGPDTNSKYLLFNEEGNQMIIGEGSDYKRFFI